MSNKVKSFTLTELLIVMIITVIIIGIAFATLRFVQNQINKIEVNLDNNTRVNLFEQKIWQDFNEFSSIQINNDKLVMFTEIDTITYYFDNNFILRNNDTVKIKLKINKSFYNGAEVFNDEIDALHISTNDDYPAHNMFISKKNDLTNLMNKDGF